MVGLTYTLKINIWISTFLLSLSWMEWSNCTLYSIIPGTTYGHTLLEKFNWWRYCILHNYLWLNFRLFPCILLTFSSELWHSFISHRKRNPPNCSNSTSTSAVFRKGFVFYAEIKMMSGIYLNQQKNNIKKFYWWRYCLVLCE